MAFLPGDAPFYRFRWLTVTKAFRLDWHFCLGLREYIHDQTGYCHKSLSAGLAFLPTIEGGDEPRLKKRCHKSLSAGLAFLPRGLTPEWHRVQGGVTKAFRLDWHFCQAVGFKGTARGIPGHKSLSAGLAFLPIRDDDVDVDAAITGHKSLSAGLAFLPKSLPPPG